MGDLRPETGIAAQASTALPRGKLQRAAFLPTLLVGSAPLACPNRTNLEHRALCHSPT
jgi:hypothetical protein